jgi:hypothetical protein
MGYVGTPFLQQDLTSVRRITKLHESRLREAGVKGMKWGTHAAQAHRVATSRGFQPVGKRRDGIQRYKNSKKPEENLYIDHQGAWSHDRSGPGKEGHEPMGQGNNAMRLMRHLQRFEMFA